ncbi:hypothetical protein NESM_000370800 [Novymonas esmeraldas]|uniref:Uncharacterized protein n=1 Tax=Novymonas esmeraldas TaxID=1808958 RepID=A0AAW0ELB8_9TRYP
MSRHADSLPPPLSHVSSLLRGRGEGTPNNSTTAAVAAYRSAAALTEQLEGGAMHAQRRHLPATWNTADIIALYLRRERLAIHCGARDASEATPPPLRCVSPTLLLLGDDAAVCELAAVLRMSTSTLLPSRDDDDGTRARGSSMSSPQRAAMAAPLPEVYTLPSGVRGLGQLRAELCRWCDVVLLCYDVRRPETFAWLESSVVPAVAAACSPAAADAVDPVDGDCPTERAVWCPATTAPPLLLVGLGAEAQLGHALRHDTPYIANADVVASAAAMGVHRVVLMYTHAARHRDILLEHCRVLRDVVYESLASPVEQGRRAALKVRALHALLRTPPPVVEVHADSRTVHVHVPPHVPADDDGDHRPDGDDGDVSGVACVCRCLYRVGDVSATGADATTTTAAAAAAAQAVPLSGVISFDDIFLNYTRSTGRPAHDAAAAAVVVTVYAVVPYLFPSEVVQQRIAAPLPAPLGYVDVVHRTCHMAVPRGLSRSGAPVTVSYTLRRAPHIVTTTTTATSAGAATAAATRHARKGRGSSRHDDDPAPRTLQLSSSAERVAAIELDGGGDGDGSVRIAAVAEQDGLGVWRPSPGRCAEEPHCGQRRELHVIMSAASRAGAAASLVTAPAVVAVPPVLPPPLVDVDAVTQSLRLRVPGYRADQVELRYTLDGTTPTYDAGVPYEAPVALRRAELGDRVHVRAAAYPRLAFASPETHARIDLAADTAPSPPRLQDDERLDATYVRWGTPAASSSHTPRRRTPQPHCGSARRAGSFSRHQSPTSARPSSRRRVQSAGGGSSSGASSYEAAPSTRSAQLRRDFNTGLYTPPRRSALRDGAQHSPSSQRRRWSTPRGGGVHISHRRP